MDKKIRLSFTQEETHNLINYLAFINGVEKETYNLEDSINIGLSKEEWKKILQYLDKRHILVHPERDGYSTTLDLTSVKEKIKITVG
jgi:hypothetical protein